MKRLLLIFFGLGLAVFAQPDRGTPPPPQPAKLLTLPQVTKVTLGNGLEVWFAERHEVPVVELQLIVSAGAEHDPQGQFGLASLTADLLTEGAGGKNALELADAVDSLGASLRARADFDSATVSFHVPASRLKSGLDLLKHVIGQPDFPKDDLERRRKELLLEIAEAKRDPNGLMMLAFPQALYPLEHRYSSPTFGREEAIKGFTREQVLDFYRSAYRPERTVLVVVGDVTPEQGLPLIETSLGTWKGQGKAVALSSLPPAPQAMPRGVVLVDRPGSAQTAIRIGRIAVARSTPHYHALTVLNTILGGSFTSRLNSNLREDHGYTYGARSTFEMRHQPGPFFAMANVETDKTGLALQEFFNEFQAIREPVDREELARAKNYLAYGFPSDFLTTSQLATQLGQEKVYHLPSDFYATYVAKVLDVSGEDVQRMAIEEVTPESMVVVLVGDKKAIKPQLKDLDFGPVTEFQP